MTGAADIGVYLESGAKRVFACALDWPGWCRSGKDEEQALQTLAAYQPRYAEVASEADLAFPAGARLDVVERLPGSAGTDFGVPGSVAGHDLRPLERAEAERLAALLEASWKVFDRIVAGAPAELRKGPRGGGRDRDKIVQHVLEAEAAYVRKIGLRLRQPDPGDGGAVSAFRRAVRDRFREESDGGPLTEKGWPARYAVRRFAWHVLDHAWEIQDRSPGPAGAAP
jgi:hypothetical protein